MRTLRLWDNAGIFPSLWSLSLYRVHSARSPHDVVVYWCAASVRHTRSNTHTHGRSTHAHLRRHPNSHHVGSHTHPRMHHLHGEAALWRRPAKLWMEVHPLLLLLLQCHTSRLSNEHRP